MNKTKAVFWFSSLLILHGCVRRHGNQGLELHLNIDKPQAQFLSSPYSLKVHGHSLLLLRIHMNMLDAMCIWILFKRPEMQIGWEFLMGFHKILRSLFAGPGLFLNWCGPGGFMARPRLSEPEPVVTPASSFILLHYSIRSQQGNWAFSEQGSPKLFVTIKCKNKCLIKDLTSVKD